jgi:DNA polymerase-1
MRRSEEVIGVENKKASPIAQPKHGIKGANLQSHTSFGSSIELPRFLTELDPSIYRSDNYVVLDWETTNLDKGFAGNRGNRIVLGTWILGADHQHAGVHRSKRNKSGVSFKFGNEFEQGELVEAVLSADFIVAHFAKFELQWLVRAGVDISRILPWDTVLGEYVIAGNRRRALDLDSVAKRRSLSSGKESLVAALISSGICPSEIPEEWLAEYGCQDTSLAHHIFIQQREEIISSGLLPVMFTRCLTTPVLADIELNGLKLDQKRVNDEFNQVQSEHSDARRALDSKTGGINLNSPKQVASYLYDTLGFKELTRNGKSDRTEAGGRRTDSEGITRLVATTTPQREFTEIYGRFRPLETKLGILEKFRDCCAANDGVLYANINQAVTQTHRLASSGKEYKVQIQNIDRKLKKVFTARHPGWLVGEADGSQLEFRVAAHLGRDQVALADIRNPDFDAHYQTAETILQKVRADISKDERSDIKPFTFKPLYGGMSGTEAERAYYRFFQEKYNGIYQTQEGWAYDVLRDKYLITEWGLKFYWPDTKLEVGSKGGKGYIKNRTSIFNYPVQSLATAEIIPIALVYTWHYIKALGLKMFLVNTVHDSVIAELPQEEEEIFRDVCEYCFTSMVFEYLSRVYRIRFSVPLGTETKVGAHWSEGKERKYDLDPDVYFQCAD